MTTTTASPELKAQKAESEFTRTSSIENMNLAKLPLESAKDPESLKASEVKPQPGVIPEVEMTPQQLRRHNLEGLRVIIGGSLMHLVLGTFYLWGAVSLYVASYLRASDPSIDINLVKLVYPLMLFAINFGMPFGVRLSQRFGARPVCLVTMAVIVVSVFVSGFMDSFGGLIFFYGILFGFASGIIYMIPVTCTWRYFPHLKGATSGIIIGCFGFGTLIFNYVALAIVNPDNETASVLDEGTKYFTPDIYNRVPKMFKILAGCYLVLGTLGSLLVAYPKATPKNYLSQVKTLSNQSTKNGEQPKGKRHVDSVGEGLKTFPYWMLFFITMTTSFYGLLLNNNYKVYGMTTIGDDLFLTTVGSVGAASNGISRFVWASLMDRFGYKKIFSCMLVIQAIIAGTFVSIADSKALYLIWYMISMSCQGGSLTMQPTITAKIFGPKKSSLIYPFVYFGFCISNISAFFLTKYGQKNMSWASMYWIAFGISVIPIVLVLFFNEYPTFGKIEQAEKAVPVHTDEDKKSLKA